MLIAAPAAATRGRNGPVSMMAAIGTLSPAPALTVAILMVPRKLIVGRSKESGIHSPVLVIRLLSATRAHRYSLIQTIGRITTATDGNGLIATTGATPTFNTVRTAASTTNGPSARPAASRAESTAAAVAVVTSVEPGTGPIPRRARTRRQTTWTIAGATVTGASAAIGIGSAGRCDSR